jgi:hypothetical protein
MKLFFTFFMVLFFTMPMFLFAAEGKVNFSGDWALNEDKSELGEGRRGFFAATKMTATQGENNLTLERTSTRRSGDEVTTKSVYTLDGKECENSTDNSASKSTANWSDDGNSLNISSIIVFEWNENSMEVNTVEIWSLIEGGKALSLDYTTKSSRGERKATYVYDKK